MSASAAKKPSLPDGLVAVVKRDCPTCSLIEPVLCQLREVSGRLTVYTQDDPSFPSGLRAVDDRTLEMSWHYAIETVPTLLRIERGTEVGRTVGWNRKDDGGELGWKKLDKRSEVDVATGDWLWKMPNKT